MLQPTQDWCVVKHLEANLSDILEVTDTWGLRDPSMQGEIVAIGPGIRTKKGRFVPTQLKVGAKVVFNRKRRELYQPGYFLLRERDIDGVVDGGE